MITNQRKAYLSEIVDGSICGTPLTNWETCDDFEEEIISDLEESEDFSPEDYVYLSECIVDYSNENDESDVQDDEE